MSLVETAIRDRDPATGLVNGWNGMEGDWRVVDLKKFNPEDTLEALYKLAEEKVEKKFQSAVQFSPAIATGLLEASIYNSMG